MGRASRNDNDVSFTDLARFTTTDLASANLICGYVLTIYNRAACDERGCAFLHINNVCVLGVNFSHASLVSPACVDHVLVVSVKQYSPLRERFLNLILVEVSHVGGFCDLFGSVGFGNRQVFILLGAGRPVHTDPIDDFAVQGDRYSTLQRSKVIQSNHRSMTALDDVFEDLGGFFKENRCACFSDGNTSARSKCPV